MTKRVFLLLSACMFVSQAFAANTDLLKVHVTQAEGTEVKVNIPLNTIEAFRPTLEEALGDVQLDGQEINLRQIWQTIKDTGPNDYVEINDDGNHILVSTTESDILIRIEGEENANVRIPFAVADAFLGSDHIDFDSLLEALYAIEGDLVSVTGDEVQVRVWIERAN